MTPNEIRAELLGQHADLRATIEQVRQAVGRVQGSDVMRAELRVALGRLSKGLRDHNRREEALLGAFLLTVDALGPVREQVMNEEHVAEHIELYDAFVDANAVSDAAIAQGTLVALLDRVIEHMAREERYFLGDDVLKGDRPIGDYFGG
jgi:Hemerythrin HHE cation binding domain